jgi:hypothetical protein
MAIVTEARPVSLFDQLPNRTVLSTVHRRSPISRMVRSQVKVPAVAVVAGIAAAAVTATAVTAVLLVHR